MNEIRIAIEPINNQNLNDLDKRPGEINDDSDIEKAGGMICFKSGKRDIYMARFDGIKQTNKRR